MSEAPLPHDPAAFFAWPGPAAGAEDHPLTAPTAPAALPRRLGPFPSWRGAEEVVLVLEDVYRKASAAARGAE